MAPQLRNRSDAASRARKRAAKKRAKEKQALSRQARGRRGLGARIALVIAALVFCIFPVLVLASPVSYIPLVAAVLLVAISWLYLQVLRRSFAFSEEQMTDSCERGLDAKLAVVLENRSVLPFPRIEVAFFLTDLFGQYEALRTMTATLGPKEKSTHAFSVRFEHLGRYSCGIDHIIIHDLLGLFHARVDNDRPRSVVVRPRLFDFSQPDISEATDDESNNMLKPIVDDSTDYASVREYRYGDPLKTIHWNLSARSADGTMFTRLFETYVSPTLSVVMDSFADSGDAEELMGLFDGIVESAASLSDFARKQGIECTIHYLDRSFEPATACLASSDDADELVLDMHRIESATGEHMRLASLPIDLLRAQGTGSFGSSNVAFATSRIDDDIVTALIDTAARRRNPLLLLTVPASLGGRERNEFLAPVRRLSAAGIATFVIESNEHETKVVL